MTNATLEAPTTVTAVEHKVTAAMQPYLISDEQFLKAMERAVRLKGPQYRYPPVSYSEPDPWRFGGHTPLYRNAETGEPSCLIGVALAIIDPGLCPGHDVIKSAASVMKGLASPRAIYAAVHAQAAQDQSAPWSTALMIYKQRYQDYTEERARLLKEQQASMNTMMSYFSNGSTSIATYSGAFTNLGVSMGKISVTLT